MDTTKNDRKIDVTDDDLQILFKNLTTLEVAFINEAKLFFSVGGINGNLHTMDLFCSAIVNRSISLKRGFISLAKENNYICAIPLIRMQIDNCLRFYASTLVVDYNHFFIEYLKGTHIRKLKDASGQSMTDRYLLEKLDKNVFQGILNLYQNTSSHIHLSNEHSFLQTKLIENKERTIGTRIGFYDFYSIDQKVDFAYNMYMVSELLLKLIHSWTLQKGSIEKLISESEK